MKYIDWNTVVRKDEICLDIRFTQITPKFAQLHYDDVIMGAIASQITSLTIVYSTVYSDADQIIPQSSAPLAFVWGIHQGPVNSPHKWPVTREMFPFDDVIMGKTAVLQQDRIIWKPRGSQQPQFLVHRF